MGPELVLGGAVGLAAATVCLGLYSTGALYRFRRLTAIREILEARCAALRDEAEGHEAMARELARVRAEREALQEERASVQRELEHLRAEWEARIQKKAKEGEWFVVRQYAGVSAKEILVGLNTQVETTLALLWHADKEKNRPMRHVRGRDMRVSRAFLGRMESLSRPRG